MQYRVPPDPADQLGPRLLLHPLCLWGEQRVHIFARDDTGFVVVVEPAHQGVGEGCERVVGRVLFDGGVGGGEYGELLGQVDRKGRVSSRSFDRERRRRLMNVLVDV